MRRLPRLVLWLGWNAGLVWLAWAGVHGNAVAALVLQVGALSLGATMLLALCDGHYRSRAASQRTTAAGVASSVVCGAVAVFLAWHGWRWTPLALLVWEVGEALGNGPQKSRR